MATNKLKVMLSFMREINDGTKPCWPFFSVSGI